MASKWLRRRQMASSQANNVETNSEGSDGCDDVNKDEDILDEKEDNIRAGVCNQLGEQNLERLLPAPTSHVASLNKELKVLETRYFRTRLGLEKTSEKNTQLRREMKKVLGNNAKLERDNGKLRHLVRHIIDRIQSQRKEIEQQAISNRDYAKKIEHCFFMGTKGKSLAQCNLDLSSRLRSLKATLKERNEALETMQQERDEARDKLSILQRALEVRLEAHVINGSLHTGLLLEISKLQDQGEALALQLDQERKSVSALQKELQSSQNCQEELEETRTVRETWIATLEKERAALDEKLAQLSNDVQIAACEKTTLLRYIHEQAEAKFRLEAQLKDEKLQRRQKMERAKHKLELEQHENQELKASVQIARQEVERQRGECERFMIALREQQESNTTQKCREAALQSDLERLSDAHKKLEADYMATKDVCRELQTTVEQHEDSGRRLRTEIEVHEASRRDLLGQLELKQSEEHALREAMEGTLQDLAALSKQRNDAARAMSEAVTISASSLEEQQALEHQVETQRTQIEKLKCAKNSLQNAMLEQLAALRKQLHIERRQRIEAEARLKRINSPWLEAAETHDVLVSTIAAKEPHKNIETTDSDAPQPMPSAPLPSPAPLPPFLPTRLTSTVSLSSSSSSTSSSDEEGAGELPDDKHSFVNHLPTVLVTPNSKIDQRAPISLLELAEDSDENTSHPASSTR
ncbi:hypothetical protein Plhal304r1_c003g0013551 [Plasmopara halstedii]